MKSHPNPALLFPNSLLTLCVIFLFSFSPTFIFAQDVEVVLNEAQAPIDAEGAAGKDFSTGIVITLPPLDAVIRADSVEAFYSFLYIFGDGDFKMHSRANTERHLFLTEGGPTTYRGRVYSIGHYSGGDEPPKLQTPPINTNYPAAFIADTVQRVVQSGEWLNVQRNAEVKAGDTLVQVLSFQNNATSLTNGAVLFLYGSPISNETIKITGKKGMTALPNFADFTHHESLMYDNRVNRSAKWYTNLPATISDRFQYMLAYEFAELEPGEEVRVFVDMSSDPNLMAGLNEESQYRIEFMALLYSQDGGPVVITEEEQAAIENMNLQDLTAVISSKPADVQTNYSVQTDSTTINPQSSTVSFLGDASLKDVFISSASLVKSHDPNYIQAQACACTNTHPEYHKLLVTVHCENDGFGAATNIYMDVILPDGMSADLVVDTPVLYHPFVTGSEDNVFMEVLDENTIRWHMDNFQIEGIPNYGQGHPLTYAEVSFVAFTTQDPATLDSLQAMVRFGSVDSDPVYTPKIKVSLVDATTVGNDSLVCGTCKELDEIGCFSFWCTIPWWVWLILTLLIIVGILVYRSWSS